MKNLPWIVRIFIDWRTKTFRWSHPFRTAFERVWFWIPNYMMDYRARSFMGYTFEIDEGEAYPFVWWKCLRKKK